MTEILEPGGKFYLVLPDKRKTFDFFRPMTTISDVLLTHVEDPEVHSLRTIVESECETTPSNAWQVARGNVQRHVMANSYTDEETALINGCVDKAILKYLNANGSYIDAHRWVFSDQWFFDLMEALNKLGVLPQLQIETLYPTCSEDHCSEFYVVMKKCIN